MKRSSKAAAQRTSDPAAPVIDIPLQLSRKWMLLIMAALLLLAAGAGLYYALPMEAEAGVLAFPLDDAWVAHTFARELAEHGRYAYHELDAPTSGSTSPLHVLLLSAVYGLSEDIFTPAAVFGVLSLGLTALFLFLLSRRLFETEQWLAVVAAVLFLLWPRVQSEALSGMPTLLFTACITASAYWYFARRSLLFFLASGAALWLRPDALVFMLAALLHLVYHHAVVPKHTLRGDDNAQPVSRNAAVAGAATFALLLTGYAVFNLSFGGSVFPNTIPAKMAYYGAAGEGFLRGALDFYATGPGAVLIIFALFAVVKVLVELFRRSYAPLLMAALFAPGLVAAYWLFLPVLVDGGRYLVPTLPFFIILGIAGVRGSFGMVLRVLPLPSLRPMFNMLSVILLFAAMLAAVLRMGETRAQHYEATRYIYDRGAGAGIWLGKRAPEDAKVGTHLIGTVGYYSHCRIVDFRGIVTPALIPSIGNLAALELALRAENVDYVAALREQFEIVNSNPKFLSNPTKPEVMEVYPYEKGRTHVMSQSASAVNSEAIRLMQRRDDAAAAALLRQSVGMDPLSSRTFTLLGIALLNSGDTLQAEHMFNNALKLHPEYSPAIVPLADLAISRGKLDEGIGMLEDAVKYQRWSRSANSSLRAAMQRRQQDSLRASQGTVTR